MTSQVDPAPDPQGEEPEEKVVTSQQDSRPEVIHFTAGNRIIDNAYGATIARIVGAYLDNGYTGPEKECEVMAFGLVYKVLKRSNVTVFYTDTGLTVFDVENTRLEEEYQCRHRNNKTEPDQPEEPLSAYGTPRKVYPEDSLITTPGCEGGHDCFCCHLDCDIRQQDCYCVEAPMGNPFPCEMVAKTSELQEKIGARCQMVNHDLADHRAGDHEPVPCCKKCTDLCEYICSRARNVRDSAAAMAQVERHPEEEKIDESYNIGDLPQAKESLLKQLAKVLVERCGSRMILDGITHTGGSTKERLRDIDRQDDGIALQDGVQAYPSEEIIEFFYGEEDLGVCTYARFETQARKALDEWVRAGKPQSKPAPEPEPKPPKEVIDAEFSEIQAEQVEDIYDSEILADMIKQMEDGLALMADRWKVSQPWTYKKYRMAVEAYKMYQAAHD